MSGLENFDHLAAAQMMSEQIIPRFYTLGPNDAIIFENQNIIQEFNKIAGEMLMGEEGISIPGSDQLIPLNEALAMQGLTLFSEGVYFAITKCMELGINGDVKTLLLQQLAMDIYGQAKQIVASTYGQEATPGFQFTIEQQIQMVAQGAENALMYYINEYEKQNGPIQVEFPEEVPRPTVEEILGTEPEMPSAPVAEAPIAPMGPQKGPTPHDKYAAVALLMTTLPQEQRGKVLRNFNAEEKELIEFYSFPQHIEQNLDITCVQEHLKRFKEVVKQGTGGLKSQAYRSIGKLVESYSPQMLLSCVKDERPLIKQYLEQHLGLNDTEADPERETADGAPEARHFSEALPPRVEEVLHRYLQQQLSRNNPSGSSRTA